MEKAENSISILVGKGELESHQTTATLNSWVYYEKEGIVQNFAPIRGKNSVKGYVQSHEYFKDLVQAIQDAKNCIYITGWQVNWDALITPELRLADVLLAALEKNRSLRVYILPWDDTSPIDTGDEETSIVLMDYLNRYLKRNAVRVSLHNSQADISAVFFSHHQKCVVIDREIAFMGGIDLAYGRYGNGYDLDPTKDGRQVLNRYNPCIYTMSDNKDTNMVKPIRSGATHRIREKEHKVIHEKIWQYAESGLEVNQPIMPWQDIHLRIEGESVCDLVLNFVLRWNTNNSLHLKLPTEDEYKQAKKEGNSSVQILRSASKNMREIEYKRAYRAKNSSKVKIADVIHPPRTHQNDIYVAMLRMIDKAQRFIYIENQFFISNFGQASISEVNDKLSLVADSQNGPAPWATSTFIDPSSAKELPKNMIISRLADKVDQCIFAYQPYPFHIYVTLPVHPEGLLNSGATIATIHLTMQTIVFGSDSLLNRIRKSLWIYQQLNNDNVPREQWDKTRSRYEEQMGDQYKTIPLSDCDKYVTLFNLRSWAVLGEQCVTEQIYVHSKLMIVDDLYAIIGSANINDRSLSGMRDSELAALIIDNDTETVMCPSRQQPLLIRKFAKQLRLKTWSGLFGEGLEQAMEIPELANNVQAIQSRARKNTELFESVFPFIPRNYLKNEGTDSQVYRTASIWPVLDNKKINSILNDSWDDFNDIAQDAKKDPEIKEVLEQASVEKNFKKERASLCFNKLLMPFNKVFWQNYPIDINQQTVLSGVKGYITLVPIRWTEEENNAIPYHGRLVN